RTILVQHGADVLDGEFGDIGEILVDLVNVQENLFEVLAILVNIEKRDAADGNLQEFFDIILTDFPPAQQMQKRVKAGADFLLDAFLGIAFSDALVDALLDEDLREGASVKLVFQLLQFQFQFPLEVAHQFMGIAAQDLFHIEDHGSLIAQYQAI